MITGFVQGQVLRLSAPVVAADTLDYLTAQFVFRSADWSGMEKWAHFSKGGTVYDIPLTDDKIRREDHLNLGAGEWKVYVHGNRFADGTVVERITTAEDVLRVVPTGTLNGEPFPEMPASVTEQILARLEDVEQNGGGSGGGISRETDPTVSDWAKQPKKPTYTAEEVGAATKEQFNQLSGEIADVTGYARTNQLLDYENTTPIKAYVWEPNVGILSNGTVWTVSVPVSVTEPTKVTVHREINSSHFIVGSSTDVNAGIGSPITNRVQYESGTNWHTLTIDIDETIKSICITYSKSNTSSITYNPDDVLKTLMVQYGGSFTGYEPYLIEGEIPKFEKELNNINASVKKINNICKRTHQLLDYENSVPFHCTFTSTEVKSHNNFWAVSIPVNVTENTTVTVHRDINASRFLVASSTDANAGVGSPITTYEAWGTGDWHILQIDIDETIKSIIVIYWLNDFTEGKTLEWNAVEADKVLKSLMVQYGAFTGYEPYIVTQGFEMLKQHEADPHQRLTKVLQRQGLAWEYSEDYMRQIAAEANSYTSPDKLTFLFITDTHAHSDNIYLSGIAANLTKYVPCSFIAHGGDIIDGVSKKDNELMLLTDVNRQFLESNCPTFYVKGNHDDNCLYARGGVTAPIGLASDYITNDELYMRSNVFNKDRYVTNSAGDMYFYYDDDATKIRSIFINGFDNPETVDSDGKRIEDARTARMSEEQVAWMKSTAFNFGDKSDKEEWAVIMFAHSATFFETAIQGVISQFVAGTGYFADQGEMEIIAIFHGDDHLDGLGAPQFSGKTITRIVVLNANQALDNASVVTPDQIWLMPPLKSIGTEDETAFDIATIDRENHLIYLTRYGARSYVYNAETEKYDTLANRTRIIDYKTATYTQLV
jgi:predicted MPP superfamily phosphohydrolase